LLAAEKEVVEEPAALRQLHAKEKGEAQLATQMRNVAVEVLTAKDRELCKLLKPATGKRNDLPEIVGAS